MRPDKPVTWITGASAGIGEASARLLAKEGTFRLVLGARRIDRLSLLAEELSRDFGTEIEIGELDVTKANSVSHFVAAATKRFGDAHILINNAGMAAGRGKLLRTSETAWKAMLETNVEGVLRMTQAALPMMKSAGWGHIVMVGSIAGHQTYSGGTVYCATKHAVRAIRDGLRQELCGLPIRVSSIDPGMVHTDFSAVRFGSKELGDAVYQDMDPLVSEDIAECIRWVLSLPDRVNIDEIIVQPRDQANVFQVHRRTSG